MSSNLHALKFKMSFLEYCIFLFVRPYIFLVLGKRYAGFKQALFISFRRKVNTRASSNWTSSAGILLAYMSFRPRPSD